jgi:CBS domain containing-hemolysin-like protein
VIEVLLIVVALLLVAACGAFVAAEFAFVTVDRSTVDQRAEAGDAPARGVQKALRSLSTQLSAAQVGITVTNLSIGFLAEPAIAKLIDSPLEAIGVPEGAVSGVAITIALILATAFTMVFGELVPKNLAIARPLATARAVQRFQRGFTDATRIVIVFCNETANGILRRLGIEPQEELASARSPEELSSLVRRSAEHGTLESETATLLERSLAFGERHAEDVMTPRGNVHILRADAPVLEVMRTARDTGHSRFPVMDEEGERFVGLVHIKHAMGIEIALRGQTPIAAVMAEPLVVPSTLELDPLLEMLRQGGLQMALVADEYGNVDGIVTLEDLIEEIVGDVRDEYDPFDDSVRSEGENVWTLSGLLRPDEIAEATGVQLPEDEQYETLGGLVSTELERIPEAGSALELEARQSEGGRLAAKLTVLGMDELRVDRVRLEVTPIAEPREGEEESE